MENYVVVDVMCPGSFGITFFVEERNSGLEYTLKKVECLDETRANRSLQEALCLIDVNHPNIVRYRELFVLWDKHSSRLKGSKRRSLKTSTYRCSWDKWWMHWPTSTTETFYTDEKCWMAPESVMLLQWSDKSDIWSLGCVLLDMLICHILNEEASLLQLSQLRQDLSPLDLIICKDFRKLLTRMLSHNPENRANVWVLANEAVVKQSLILCGSSPHSIKRTLPQGVTGPPFHEGIDSVLDFMMTYTDVEAIQLSVLSYLLKEERKAMSRIGDVVEAVTSAMLSHSESACIQLKSFQLIQLLLTAEEACELIVKLGSVHHVLNTLKDYPHEKDIIIPCCKIIQCTLEKGYGAPESFPDAVETLCIVGEMHIQDAVVTECLCAALQFLINQALHEEKDIEKATCLLIHQLKSHPNEAVIVNHVFVAMAGLITTSETAALQLLHVPDEINGVYHIMAARRHHSDYPKVTENFCHLLKQLVQHDAVIPELLAKNVQEELGQILQQYESITETVLLAQDALSKMMSIK
ncbi:serine/threonine kinase-like domain-containing protein STKLD1 isoform X3 [Ictalurus punctatus]|uniref:Serine/threonine kinase-like domain-containing protein STKLD1 isoform X3 n=1 Tax=Ictalurus punctatus TaxID=7998 RepID=A0A2D0QXY2_ICTPU|nr:serine/threonine kinase-like domain-containing protein STKLD1 isoform X3 [Ictalurus punctatus]